MRKCFSILFLVSVTYLSCKQKKAEDFSLHGEIKGLNDRYVYLNVPEGDSARKDSAEVTNGHFVFRGMIAEPTMVLLLTKERYVRLFLENSDIKITGNMDSLDKVRIAGSASQAAFDSLNSSVEGVTGRIYSLYDLLDSANKKKDSTMALRIEMQIDTLRDQRRSQIKTYICSHPNSPISVFEINDMIYSQDYPVLAKLFGCLDYNTQNSIAGKQLKKQLDILHRSAIGQPIIDFEQNDLNNQPVRFSEYSKGKYVLLDFWASWCGPCRGENPNVVKAYNQFKEKGLVVLGVSLDEDSAKWRKAVTEDKLPWTQVSDLQGWKNSVAAMYGIQAIPYNLIIDPKGFIVAKNLRGNELEQKLSEFMK